MAKITKTSARAAGAQKVKPTQTPKADTKERKPRAPKEPTELDLAKKRAATHPEKLVREWNERRGGRVRGATTGLGVEAAWGYIFERNAKAKVAERMTDEQISEWLKAEFPGKLGWHGEPTKVFETGAVQTTRAKYNKAAFHPAGVDVVRSQPWDAASNTWLEVKRGRRAGAPVQRKTKDDGVPAAPGFGKGKGKRTVRAQKSPQPQEAVAATKSTARRSARKPS